MMLSVKKIEIKAMKKTKQTYNKELQIQEAMKENQDVEKGIQKLSSAIRKTAFKNKG